MTWAHVRLGDYAEIRGGKRLPIGESLQSTPNGAPYLRITDWSGGTFDQKNLLYVPISAQSAIDRYRIYDGEIFISIVGTIGLVALIDTELDNAFLTENAAKIEISNPSLDASFLRYVLTSDYGQNEISRRAVGSTQPKLALHRIRDIPIPLPPLGEQRAIAEVLGALDDKIAANTKLASTTESLMLASFRELLLTTNVRQVSVKEFTSRLHISRKFSKSEIVEHGDYPVYDQSDDGHLGYLNGGDYLDASPQRPVLYFGDHTCKLRLSAEKFFVGPNTIPFVANGMPTLTLFAALQGVQKHEEYKRHWGNLMSKSVAIPSPQACENFEEKFAPVLPLIGGLLDENSTLATTRDALLPQLMSGKLSVKGAASLVSAAV